jgi:hypothetical protein
MLKSAKFRFSFVILAFFVFYSLFLVISKKYFYSSNNPPFWGTVWIDNNILNASDPSSFINASYEGIGYRTMYDRRTSYEGIGYRTMYDLRTSGWKNLYPFLFRATFSDGLVTEIQVNPEFETKENALEEAQKYAFYIGKLPTALREKVETVWIHKGDNAYGGGNNNILIHTGAGERDIANGFIEEVLMHEASHTSLDPDHANSEGWLAAQEEDGHFISTYARDYPLREDIAESYLMYFAVRYKPDRISASLKETILNTIPNRIAYFDSMNLNMHNSVNDSGSRLFEKEK